MFNMLKLHCKIYNNLIQKDKYIFGSCDNLHYTLCLSTLSNLINNAKMAKELLTKEHNLFKMFG